MPLCNKVGKVRDKRIVLYTHLDYSENGLLINNSQARLKFYISLISTIDDFGNISGLILISNSLPFKIKYLYCETIGCIGRSIGYVSQIKNDIRQIYPAYEVLFCGPVTSPGFNCLSY